MTTHPKFSCITRVALGVLLVSVLATAGCGRVDYEQEAAEIADRLYEHLALREYDEASDLYAERFFERVPRDRWRNIRTQIEETLGVYEDHRLIHGRTQTFGPEDDPGEEFTVMMYRVTYARDEAIEQLTFSTRRRPLELVNHQLVSDRITINLEDAETPVRTASAAGSDPPATPDPGPDKPAGEAVETAAIEPTEPADQAESIDERIGAEVRRLTSGNRNPEIARYVDGLVVTAIAPGRHRIIVNDRLLVLGESLQSRHPVRLSEVHPRLIVFQDDGGARYEKPFMTRSR